MESVQVMNYVCTCPLCNEKLKPVKSVSQAKYNLEMHLRKHSRAGQIKSEAELQRLLSQGTN